MPRRNRPHRPPASAGAPSASWARRESWPDGDWMVRTVPGPAAVKAYRCPGCDQEIPAGVAHVVSWPDDPGASTERRHWHSGCWSARDRRRPTRR